MTGRGQPSLRVQAALDRLAWGVGDLKRVLLEHGADGTAQHAQAAGHHDMAVRQRKFSHRCG